MSHWPCRASQAWSEASRSPLRPSSGASRASATPAGGLRVERAEHAAGGELAVPVDARGRAHPRGPGPPRHGPGRARSRARWALPPRRSPGTRRRAGQLGPRRRRYAHQLGAGVDATSGTDSATASSGAARRPLAARPRETTTRSGDDVSQLQPSTCSGSSSGRTGQQQAKRRRAYVLAAQRRGAVLLHRDRQQRDGHRDDRLRLRSSGPAVPTARKPRTRPRAPSGCRLTLPVGVGHGRRGQQARACAARPARPCAHPASRPARPRRRPARRSAAAPSCPGRAPSPRRAGPAGR